MSSPYVILPELTLRAAPAFCGTIDYYARVAAFGTSFVDDGMRFDKRRKSVHRTVIADVHGPLRLTVPIVHPESSTAARWSDIRVSDHGNWSDVHRVALESAYGRTPFFEFYADRFLPLLKAEGQPVTELDRSFDTEIRRILLLPPPLHRFPDNPALVLTSAETPLEQEEYYQVRRDRLGFIPGLSILDLIFNLGPESPLYLAAHIARNKARILASLQSVNNR